MVKTSLRNEEYKDLEILEDKLFIKLNKFVNKKELKEFRKTLSEYVEVELEIEDRCNI